MDEENKVIESQKPFSLLDFLIQWTSRVGVASLALHEYGHLYGAMFIGLYAEIRTTNIAAVYPDLARFPLTTTEHLIFYGMGGLLQCVIFLVFNFRNNDRENRMVNGMVAIHGLIYGAVEALVTKSLWGLGGLIASMAGFAAFFLFLLWCKPEIIA